MLQNGFSRYSCQIALPGFGERGQTLLQNAKVLIVGAGGLGCPAAQYLAASGVGSLGIADHDNVSLGNLHRQILYNPQDTGKNKALVACEKLQLQNPELMITPLSVMVTADNVMDIINPFDLVLDCTDNFDTKYLLNDACVLAGKPLVYAAIYQYEGQVAIWNAPNEDGTRSPNYRDVFPEANASQIPNCTEGGVLPTLAGIIGCMQANETIKYITQAGQHLISGMLIFDAKAMQCQTIKTGKTTKTNITSLPLSVVPTTVSAEDLKQRIGQYLLIDVRTSDEHKFFNIGGKNIPLSEIAENVSYLSSDKPIVFYCATGQRSAEAVKMIKKRFEAEIYSLEGGLNSWG